MVNHNLTMQELLRESLNSNDNLVNLLSAKLTELVEEIEILDGGCVDEEGKLSQFEFVKLLCGLPNNY